MPIFFLYIDVKRTLSKICAIYQISKNADNSSSTSGIYVYQISPTETVKVNGKVVYGQEPSSGESTTTECGFNYQLLAVITEVSQWGAPIVAVNHN